MPPLHPIPEEHLGQSLAEPPLRGPRPVCGLIDAVLVALFFIAAGTLFTIAAYFLTRHSGWLYQASLETLLKDPWFFIPIEAAAYLAAVAFMKVLVLLKDQGPFLSVIHWNAPDRRKVFTAVAAGAGLAIFSMIAGALLAPWTPKSLPMTEYFRDAPSSYLLAFFGILVAPLGEELFFRGILYPALKWWTGAAPALLFTAAAFALLHEGQLARAWAPLFILFIVGLAFTLAREKTGSVAMCVIIHMTYNFAIFAQVFLATQGFRHMERAALDSLRAALILW